MVSGKNEMNDQTGLQTPPGLGGSSFLTFKKRVAFFSIFMLPFIIFSIFAVTRETATFYDKLFFYERIHHST